jgi:hypothetical protein
MLITAGSVFGDDAGRGRLVLAAFIEYTGPAQRGRTHHQADHQQVYQEPDHRDDSIPGHATPRGLPIRPCECRGLQDTRTMSDASSAAMRASVSAPASQGVPDCSRQNTIIETSRPGFSFPCPHPMAGGSPAPPILTTCLESQCHRAIVILDFQFSLPAIEPLIDTG